MLGSLARTSSLLIQRKCACGGAAGTAEPCEECNKHAVSTRSIAHPAADKTKPAPDPAHVPGYIVEDGAVDLKPGQMQKSDFLAQMREEVCRTAEEALAGTGRSTAGCPYLDYWFHHYGGQAASHIEKALLRYAPAAGKAASAQEYIAIAAERARLAVVRWVRTGEIDAPKEAMAAQPATRIQFKAGPSGPEKVDSPAAVRQQLGGGAALPGDVRGRMESAFGHDFSRVRVHADAGADRLAAGLNAHAFTIGGDVAFAAGTYRPGTPAGDALIAHELAHVVQQAGAGPESRSTQVSGAEYRALEDDADRAAVGVVASLWSGAKTIAREAMPRIRSGLSLQRCSKCDPAKDVIPSGIIKPIMPNLDCSAPKRVPNSIILQDDDVHHTCTAKHCTLGLTKAKKIEPEINLEPNRDRSCTLTWVKRPTLELEHYEVTEPSKVPYGTETPEKEKCRGKTLTKMLDITEAVTQRVIEGEKEHCEDARQAYARTFARLEQFYDELAAKNFCPPEDSKCEYEINRRFRMRMGLERTSMQSSQNCFFAVTNDRDTKDYHTAHTLGKPTYSKDCTEALYSYGTDPAKILPEVGKHSFDELVKANPCGADGT